MLAGTELDIVSVCTPDFAHAEPCKEFQEADTSAITDVMDFEFNLHDQWLGRRSARWCQRCMWPARP